MVLKSRTARFLPALCLVVFVSMQYSKWSSSSSEDLEAAYRAAHSTSSAESPAPPPASAGAGSGADAGAAQPAGAGAELLSAQAKTQQLLDDLARQVGGQGATADAAAAAAAATAAAAAAVAADVGAGALSDVEAAYRAAHSTGSSSPSLPPLSPAPPLAPPQPLGSDGTADCDGHAVVRGLKPLIIMATTMGHAKDNDFKRKIQRNVLRGFMAQTPLDSVHPLVFTDQPALAAEVRQETAKVHGDGLETVASEFEKAHGFPTLRGMMKQAEAAAIKVGAPFYGYANGDILFTEDLVMSLRLLREGIDDGFFRGGKAEPSTPSKVLAKRHPLLQQGMMIIGRRTNFPFSGAKTGIFEPFIHKNEHFAKTGSGQT
jgi:hypothetical protein